ncbi:MAG: hypothetical protein RR888_10005, partial [Akkermansia sp.]
ERFNAPVLKTDVATSYRGFESHPLRQNPSAYNAENACFSRGESPYGDAYYAGCFITILLRLRITSLQL